MGKSRSDQLNGPLLETEDGSGDAILTIPDELLTAVGWVGGDTLSFADRSDGTLLLKKADNEDADLPEIAKQRLDASEMTIDV